MTEALPVTDVALCRDRRRRAGQRRVCRASPCGVDVAVIPLTTDGELTRSQVSPARSASRPA